MCPDPRTADLNIKSFSPTLNLQHTCKHLDKFRFPGQNKPVFNIQNEIDNNGLNSVVYGSSPNQLVYGDTFNGDAMYFTEENGANAIEGSMQVFTCKHGFKPYFNAVVASELQNWGARPGNEFSCLCDKGRWFCNASCRCEKYCDEE